MKPFIKIYKDIERIIEPETLLIDVPKKTYPLNYKTWLRRYILTIKGKVELIKYKKKNGD